MSSEQKALFKMASFVWEQTLYKTDSRYFLCPVERSRHEGWKVFFLCLLLHHQENLLNSTHQLGRHFGFRKLSLSVNLKAWWITWQHFDVKPWQILLRWDRKRKCLNRFSYGCGEQTEKCKDYKFTHTHTLSWQLQAYSSQNSIYLRRRKTISCFYFFLSASCLSFTLLNLS